MTKAFLFDSLCGMVYRCMFAGLDDYGHAQWVNITPGEEPKTLDEYVEDEDLEGMRFFVLSMEGEATQSQQAINGLGADLVFAVKHMQEIGVKWDSKPLELVVRVFENGKNSKRSGKYSFWIEDKNYCCSVLADVDGFDSLEKLFWTVRTYFLVLETSAGISFLSKDLRICDKLKKEAKKSDLSMFGHVENEAYVLNY